MATGEYPGESGSSSSDSDMRGLIGSVDDMRTRISFLEDLSSQGLAVGIMKWSLFSMPIGVTRVGDPSVVVRIGP